MIAQVFTLLGVMVGAISSYVVSTLGEQARYRREVTSQWTQRRLESYVQYLNDVKYMSIVARRVAAGVGLDDHAPPLSQQEGLPLLAEAETRRSSTGEMVALMSDRETVVSMRKLNQTLWRLEWFARGLLKDEDRQSWKQSVREYDAALENFGGCVRRNLGISGEYLTRDSFPSHPDRPT